MSDRLRHAWCYAVVGFAIFLIVFLWVCLSSARVPEWTHVVFPLNALLVALLWVFSAWRGYQRDNLAFLFIIAASLVVWATVRGSVWGLPHWTDWVFPIVVLAGGVSVRWRYVHRALPRR